LQNIASEISQMFTIMLAQNLEKVAKQLIKYLIYRQFAIHCWW